MDELQELTEVACRRPGCEHGYTAHDPAGGHCRAVISNDPTYRLPCMCVGFRWVAGSDRWGGPTGPEVTYGGKPEPSFS